MKFLLPFLLLVCGCATVSIPYKHEPMDQVYGVFGDCYAEGAQANPKETNSYAALTTVALQNFYPGTEMVNCGLGGTNTNDYANTMPTYLKKVTDKNHGPMTRAVVDIGLNELTVVFDGCAACTYRSTPDQAVKCSYEYKKELKAIIDAILKYNSKCEILLCTLPDPNNGGKGTCVPFLPTNALPEFNNRIHELAGQYHLQVVDVYSIAMGHLDWWVAQDRHLNNLGHAAVAEEIEKKFNVYVPPAPVVTPSVTPVFVNSGFTPLPTPTMPAQAMATVQPTAIVATVTPAPTK